LHPGVSMTTIEAYFARLGAASTNAFWGALLNPDHRLYEQLLRVRPYDAGLLRLMWAARQGKGAVGEELAVIVFTVLWASLKRRGYSNDEIAVALKGAKEKDQTMIDTTGKEPGAVSPALRVAIDIAEEVRNRKSAPNRQEEV